MLDSEKDSLIYSKLVSSQNDIVGKLAYSIYKKEELDFIKNCGHTPTEDEIRSFYNVFSEAKILELREDALEAFVMSVSKASGQILAKDILKANKWHSIAIGFLTSTIASAFWAVILYYLTEFWLK